MRKDENDSPCPETLGEYRDLCDGIGMTNNTAVQLLDRMIAEAPRGRHEVVLIADLQMRKILLPKIMSDLKADGHDFKGTPLEGLAQYKPE